MLQSSWPISNLAHDIVKPENRNFPLYRNCHYLNYRHNANMKYPDNSEFNGDINDLLKIIRCSPSHISRHRTTGFFKEGKHFINIARPSAKRGTFRYNLKACWELTVTPNEYLN